MKKILLVVLGLLVGNAYADDGSPEMKAEAKALIRAANYQCAKVNVPTLATHLLCSAMMCMSTPSRIMVVTGLLRSTIEARLWQ